MPVDSENATPVDEDANVTVMKELGLLGGEEQSSSKTTEITKETFGQTTSPICEKCSEEISLEFTKPTIFLPCKHVVHYDCVKNSHKMCPTCPSSETMSEVSTLIEQDPSDVQKKCTREASTEKSSSKKAKKAGGKKVSSTLKKLIEELLTDVPNGNRSLDETSESADNFYNSLKGLIMPKLKTKHLKASFSVILILGKLYLNDTRN